METQKPHLLIDVTLSPGEAKRAKWLTIKNRPVGVLIFACIAMSLIIVGSVMFVFTISIPENWMQSLSFIMVVIGFALVMRITRKILVSGRKQWIKLVGVRSVYQIDDKGVFVVSGGCTSWITWELFSDFCEDESMFIIRTANNRTMVVPKRCFTGTPDKARFDELVRSKVTLAIRDIHALPLDLTKLPQPANVNS